MQHTVRLFLWNKGVNNNTQVCLCYMTVCKCACKCMRVLVCACHAQCKSFCVRLCVALPLFVSVCHSGCSSSLSAAFAMLCWRWQTCAWMGKARLSVYYMHIFIFFYIAIMTPFSLPWAGKNWCRHSARGVFIISVNAAAAFNKSFFFAITQHFWQNA